MTRVLVLSDIHANLAALETVLEHAQGEYDALWCLGDVVGYGPCPNECVELMQAQATLCVVGNHDWAALGRAGVDVDSFNPIARAAVLWTRDQLSTANRQYLDALPEEPVNIEGADDFLITHASPREPVWEYILTPSIAMENFAAFHEPICLVGHTHKPVIFRWRIFADGRAAATGGKVTTVDMLQPVEGEPVALETSPHQRLILNPGSVGQPRDNDARAAYAIMDLEEMSWCHYRVEYPIELTQSQMRTAGLPQRLIDRLSFGW
ncbi:MAG: metallophosphoesterase family protein [Litorilinea sp.]